MPKKRKFKNSCFWKKTKSNHAPLTHKYAHQIKNAAPPRAKHVQPPPTSRLPPHLKPLQSHQTATFTVLTKLLHNLHFVAFWHPDLKSNKLIKPVGYSGSAQVVLVAESLLRKHSSNTVFATALGRHHLFPHTEVNIQLHSRLL